jgi:Holliday junction resolvase
MGKIFDELFRTAESKEEWLLRDNKVSKQATTAKEFSLPKPFNKRVEGVLEKDILREFIKRLKREGFAVCRLQVQGTIQHTSDGGAFLRGSTMQGMPDVIAMKNRTFYMFEVKAPGGKVSGSQLSRLQEWKAAGAWCAIVVNPNAWFSTDPFYDENCREVEGIECF